MSHQGMSDADIEEYLGISWPRLLDGLDSRVRSFHFVATRQVALVAQRSWDAHILFPIVPAPSPSPSPALTDKPNGSADRLEINDTQMAALLAFAQPTLHAYLNPMQVPIDIVMPRTVHGRVLCLCQGVVL
ncbi:hypothetical protein EDB85DRAFT_2149998 [Lactarius pseudohatsudake]|nr:hypothetical protein EDB85DRAFT_2149998 [Lactarius pseudohatsudake]